MAYRITPMDPHAINISMHLSLGLQLEEEEHVLQKKLPMEDNFQPAEKVTSSTTCKVDEMEEKDHIISSNSNLEADGKDPDTSFRSTDQISADVSSLPGIVEMAMTRKNNTEEALNKSSNLIFSQDKAAEGFSEGTDAHVANHTDKSKKYMQYSRRLNKFSETISVACIALPVSEDSINTITPGVTKMGSKNKVIDGTFLGDCPISSTAMENSVLMGEACTDSDKNMLQEAPPKPKEVKIYSRGYRNRGNNGKKKVIGLPRCSLELDQNNPAVTSLASEGDSTLVGNKKVDTVIGSDPVLKGDSEDSCVIKRADNDSPIDNRILYEMSSDSCLAEDPSIQVEVSKEKKQDEILNCSSCNIEHVPGDLHDRACSGTSAIDNIGDVSHYVSNASDNFSEGNPKAISAYCREFPPPIIGLMPDSSILEESNEKGSHLVSLNKEVIFSFQITEKVNIEEPSSSCSKEACLTPCKFESDNAMHTIQKIDPLNSMSPCVERETIKPQLENELVSLVVSDTVENVLSLDVISAQQKNKEAEKLDPERSSVGPPRKKLLVLDLNGLLADIIMDIHKVHRTQKRVGGKSIFKRPFCDEFLKFCFERFDVGIWSSRKRYNVDGAVNFLMGDSKHKLLFCWDQSKCTLTGFNTLENRHKPLVLKELKKLWDREESDLPWEKGDYSQSNTLLVDDSPYKALCNPLHTAIFPNPYHFDDGDDKSLGPGGELRVYLEGLAMSDDVQHYVQHHPFGQQAITNEDASWSFYLQVVERVEKSLALTQ